MQEWLSNIDWFSTAFLAVGIFAGLVTIGFLLQWSIIGDLEAKVKDLKAQVGDGVPIKARADAVNTVVNNLIRQDKWRDDGEWLAWDKVLSMAIALLDGEPPRPEPPPQPEPADVVRMRQYQQGMSAFLKSIQRTDEDGNDLEIEDLADVIRAYTDGAKWAAQAQGEKQSASHCAPTSA